jgi:hypothetical protein
MAEFDWWLLFVGVVAGGGLVALVLTDSVRRDEALSERETEAEATWVTEWLGARGTVIAHERVADVLRAHRAYLHQPPPDALIDGDAEAGLPGPTPVRGDA